MCTLGLFWSLVCGVKVAEKEFRLVSSPESWPLGEPVRQRGAQAGGKAGWGDVASVSADVVKAEVPGRVLGEGGDQGGLRKALNVRVRP